VFRLILADVKCELDAVEEVVGDFRARRGAPDVHPGVLACRLIGADGRTLDEQFVHPPDHVCAVLDPNASAGQPQVALLAGLGPQVFQVRFPADLTGNSLEIYRVTRVHPNRSESLLLTHPLKP
jgi:hypothetical protein